MASSDPPLQHLVPPTPAPSSPAESQLDGGEFFHEKDYQEASEAYSSHAGVVMGVAVGEDEEQDVEVEEDGELAEVWPEPKQDEHAYVAGEGGVRRRRTVHGVKQGREDNVENGHANGVPTRYLISLQPPLGQGTRLPWEQP